MSPDPYAPHSGDLSYRVLHYDLTVKYKVATNRLDGEAVIRTQALAPLDHLRLDLSGLKVSQVDVDGTRKAAFKQNDHRVTVRMPMRVEPGQEVLLRVRYAGSPAPRASRWGRVGWEELEDGVLVAAQPTGAPTWYPCNDRPSDKAHYRIQLSAEDAYTVVAPGRLESRTSTAGRTTWTFVEDIPTASYLAAVHIGRYRTEPVDLSGVTGRLHYPAERARPILAETARLPEMMALFEASFGAYPMGSYDLVVTPDPLDIPLEGQGMAVFGANQLNGQFGYQRLVAHELAHQWFGNSVGLTRWSDLWLNEGFACYAEWLWSQASGGPSAHQQAKTHWQLLDGLPQDLVLADPGPDLMFDDRVYKRGALCLHALRRTVGDEAFFAVLKAWAATYRHAGATTDDFRRLAADVTGEPVDQLLGDWLDRPQLPKLPHRARPH